MPVKFTFNNPQMRAWLLLHQTHNLVVRSEDNVFAKMGITTQQHAVLMAVKYIRRPVTPSDVAHWLDRNPNGISMLLDRMEKDGLVEKLRDLRDRRSVQVVLTNKGKEVLEQATVDGWRLIQQILGDLSEDELQMLIKPLEKVRGAAFTYLNPGKDMEEIKTQAGNMARFLSRMNETDDSQ